MPSSTRRIQILLFLVFLAAITNCGGAKERGPIETANAFAAALKQRDAAKLAQLLVRDDGKPVSEAEAAEFINRADPELPSQISAKVLPDKSEAVVLSTYAVWGAGFVTVWARGNQSLIQSVAQASSCPHTVREALAMLQADLRAYHAVYFATGAPPRNLTRRSAEQWELDRRTWLSGLAHQDELDIDEDSGGARVLLPTGRIIELGREMGCLRIEAMR